MSHVIALVALLLILCLFFPKEHINVCLKYLVECPNTCGVEIQREKVRCSVPDPDLQVEGGGGGGAGGLVSGPQFSLKIRGPSPGSATGCFL